MDLVAADAEPANPNDAIEITVITAKTFDLFILLAPLHALDFIFSYA